MAYLKKAFNKKTGRTYLSMAHGYRDKERGHTRTISIESYGYLDELQEKYEDPIAHFNHIVDEYNLKQAQETAEYTISAKKNQQLNKDTLNRKNYGYIVIMSLYHELGLDVLLINRQRRQTKIEFNTSSIMKMLVINRILAPSSKKKAYEERSRYFDFEKEDAFGLIDVYRALSFFTKYEKDIQLLIHDRITKNYGRNLDIIYYDVTNYYFEIDMEDELRKKGVSKEHRPNPIVQMGLAMDEDGMPISYEIFAGNESEKLHLRPMILELHNKYDTGRIIAVADSAQNTGNNIYYLDEGKQGYIFSQSIRGGSKDFKEYVVDEEEYIWKGEEYKRKSRIVRREIQVDFDRPDGTTYKKKVFVDQRQIVFWSKKYAIRSGLKREAALKKAQSIISNPAAYTKATSYGALKYIKNVDIDKETGEIKESTKGTPCFNLDVIVEEEKYDGYYAIVTNVFDEGKNKDKFSDGQIIDIYRGLWRIEESFKITKSDLDSQPVFLSREDRIKAHFLICYISLVIVRLIQKRTGYEYSPEKLIEAMNNISCSNESGNLYLFDYRSDISDALGEAFGIDFTRERLTRAEIKKNIGNVKKS
jgi:transposase